eukprot:1181084-Prorocentrum_minimum.AAC.1
MFFARVTPRPSAAESHRMQVRGREGVERGSGGVQEGVGSSKSDVTCTHLAGVVLPGGAGGVRE